jgi:hypothetical protein
MSRRASPRRHAACLLVTIESTRRARSAAAPALEREATCLSRGAQDPLDRGAPRASHVASRLAF